MRVSFVDPREFLRAIGAHEGNLGAAPLVPHLHQLYVRGEGEFPDLPTDPGDLAAQYNYWHACLWIPRVMFGWGRPDLGLLQLRESEGWSDSHAEVRWWRKLYDQRGQLDKLAMAVWFGSPDIVAGAHEVPGAPLPRFQPTGNWVDKLLRERRATIHGPFSSGGDNPLHLGHFGLRDPGECGDTEDRVDLVEWPQARLVDVRFPGVVDLLVAFQELKPFGVLGWRARIRCEDAGYLGEFSYCPSSDRWHLCSRRLHLLGNTPLQVLTLAELELVPEAPLDPPAVYRESVEFLVKRSLPIAFTDESPAIAFLPGEVRVSGRGGLRTILGACRRRDGRAAYVIRVHESGTLDTKDAARAHDEYSDVIDLCGQPPARGHKQRRADLRRLTGS